MSPATDTGGDSAQDGCDPIISDVAGRFALVDRGTCTFVEKAINAQNAGAIALLVANNVSGLFIPTGSGPSVTIPVFGVSQADAAHLRLSPPLSARAQATNRWRSGWPSPYNRPADLTK